MICYYLIEKEDWLHAFVSSYSDVNGVAGANDLRCVISSDNKKKENLTVRKEKRNFVTLEGKFWFLPSLTYIHIQHKKQLLFWRNEEGSSE